MSLRSALLMLAIVSAAALAFVLAALGTVVLLVDRSSGASDGATPATASKGGDQVALRRRSGGNEKGREPGDSPVKARAYFLEEIPRH